MKLTELRSRIPRPSPAMVVALIALFVALGGTTYAATGGNFILGQPNTAGAPTQLSSATTNSAGAFKVTNTNTTTGGRGITAVGGAGGFGLWASGGNVSKNTAAVHGQSTPGNAVEGISGSNSASGVYGQNNSTGYGVAGRSTSGTGVLGDSSSGWAFNAAGNATQLRGKGGFVKAMAVVAPGAIDPILDCFNSQLPPSQATSGDCGISYTEEPGAGKYHIDFGFSVDDRFASLTTKTAGSAVTTAFPAGASPPFTGFDVITFDVVDNAYADLPSYILVY
jgi:hypothetical protein